MKPLISILTLYNYDNNIFENMLVPNGVNRDDLINNLLVELAEMEIIYPNPVTMKSVIGFWAKKEIEVWNKLYNTTNIEYDPISNLRRTETYNDKQVRDLGGTTTQNITTSDTSTNSGTDTDKQYISAFNESTPTLKGQDEKTLGTSNVNSGKTDTTNTTADTGTVENNRTVSMQGSIGVVLTQQMIEAERKVDQFNIYEYIINSFKNRFCLLVY